MDTFISNNGQNVKKDGKKNIKESLFLLRILFQNFDMK